MDISVIIPTLNEAAFIEDTVTAVLDEQPTELIVSDGGSSDGTIEIARRFCNVVSSHRGRARQMNAGAEAAAGDVLLFLHADTLLPHGALTSIRDTFRQPRSVGGCFRLRFDAHSPLLRTYSAFTRLPIKSICFGDRAIFATRDAFEKVGRYPDIPIFEDLEMVKLLSRHGQFRMLPQAVTTSARRFVSGGPARQQMLNARLWIRYHLGQSPESLSSQYEYDTH
ncbi:MAG: TIGR04283 family arsenosugar biosynthesis glycosyltransferase [Rhodothermia bacterium]|nr:TIGR04283 family arsenosugar biosynthesis glycosyltransferase [Rhodothermia bacterium]